MKINNIESNESIIYFENIYKSPDEPNLNNKLENDIKYLLIDKDNSYCEKLHNYFCYYFCY
jgi:hypothetical protein